MNIEIELKKLLKRTYGAKPKFAAIIKTTDGKFYSGVSIKNSVFRDLISAEQGAISSALVDGVEKENFEKLYIMTSSMVLSDHKYIRTDFISYFLKSDTEVELYTKYGKKGTVLVKDLTTKIIDNLQ